SGELFAALLAMPQDALVTLLAVCIAPTVDVVTPRATKTLPGEELAKAVGLDMPAWWKPTAEGYFRHISKTAILDAAKTFAPSEVGRLARLKKGDLATEAERLTADVHWMPAVFGDGGAPADDLEDTEDIPATDDDTSADDVAYADASGDAPDLPMAA
ncbi:chromosome partitioning protein ParB, partial [Burkholderia multivorans]